MGGGHMTETKISHGVSAELILVAQHYCTSQNNLIHSATVSIMQAVATITRTAKTNLYTRNTTFLTFYSTYFYLLYEIFPLSSSRPVTIPSSERLKAIDLMWHEFDRFVKVENVYASFEACVSAILFAEQC